jgi:hypothetical protein
MPPLTVLAGSPYSGEQVDESTQILADGTQITRTTGFHQKAWRDSQGRIRIERPVAPAGNLSGRKGLPTLVVIQDPVAGFSYIMDDVSRVAHRVTLQTRVLPPQRANPVAAVPAPAPAPSAPPAPVAANPQRPQYSFENLGSQTIDGIQANGTRRTTLYPAGSQGNDAPFTITQEVWTSPDLNLTILTVTADPRQGTTTSKVANLSRSEPDPALFFVPVGYTVVDEAETFTVKWGAN